MGKLYYKFSRKKQLYIAAAIRSCLLAAIKFGVKFVIKFDFRGICASDKNCDKFDAARQ
ncbi:hypothetical protein [Campylobacter showae]|uniref:hypothetical protein n=1 Tax=Campylobacter showae TaxID=204 RepID=UPI0013D0B3EC|nr:hypothetical protein [Campylobacter showae]